MEFRLDRDEAIKSVVESARKNQLFLWIQADAPDSCAQLARLPLKAIWSDRGDLGLSHEIERLITETPVSGLSKQLVKIKSTIGSNTSLNELLPIVFTRGEDFVYDGLNSLVQKRTERAKRDTQFMDLGNLVSSGVLLVVGGDDMDLWEETLREELLNPIDPVLPDVPQLQVILTGLPESDKFVERLSVSLGERVNHVLVTGTETSVFTHDCYDLLISADQGHGQGREILLRIRGEQRNISIEKLLTESTFPIDEGYHILTTEDFEAPKPNASASVFKELLSNPLPIWKGYQANFTFERMYKPLEKTGRPSLFSEDEWAGLSSGTLLEVVRKLLDKSSKEGKNYTLTIPAEAGAGTTTHIRHTAFHTAQSGYPALVAKTSLQVVDYWQLTSFLTDFWRVASGDAKESIETSCLLVFDEEQIGQKIVGEIARLLESDGRNVVVIRIVPDLPNLEIPNALGRNITCQTMTSAIGTVEASSLYHHIQNVTKAINESWMPTASSWRTYLETSGDSNAFFWVCLQYFILERLGSDQDSPVEDTVTQRMAEAFFQLEKKDAEILFLVAISTIFRIPIPLQVLVGITRTNYSELVGATNSIERSLKYFRFEWKGNQGEDFELSLNHVQFARIIIKIAWMRMSNSSQSQYESLSKVFGEESSLDYHYPIELLTLVLEGLDGQIVSHRRYAESIASSILKLDATRQDVRPETVKKMLLSFEAIPKLLVRKSATILQARAITASKSTITLRSELKWAHETRAESVEREILNRFEQAERDMELALEVSESEDEVYTEDPRVLRTTLANIYEAWSKHQKQRGNVEEFERLSIKAASLYGSVMDDWPDNPYPRYGLAKLYYSNVSSSEDGAKEKDFEEIEQALAALDINPDESFREQWEELRTRILKELDGEKYSAHINSLVSQGYEIGIVLKARNLYERYQKDRSEIESLEDAIRQLEKAKESTRKSRNLWSRVYLLYLCISAHPTRKWDYLTRYKLLSELSQLEFRMHISLMYDFGVLCYQIEREDEGNRQFSRLRRGSRHHAIQNDNFEYWREFSNKEVFEEPPIKQTHMLVVNSDSNGGWAKVEGFRSNLPFSQKHPWGKTLNPEDRVRCCVRFFKGGPRAMPLRRGEQA